MRTIVGHGPIPFHPLRLMVRLTRKIVKALTKLLFPRSELHFLRNISSLHSFLRRSIVI